MTTRLRSSTRASTAASEFLADVKPETKTKGDTRRTASAKTLKPQEMTRLIRIATSAFILSNLFIGLVFYVVHNDLVRLYPNSIKIESLKGFNSRAEFSIRYQTLLYTWLVFCVNAVIYARITKKALNPLVDNSEKHIQPYKNILTNSFEQIVISSFLQLAFVSFADHSYTLKFIPAINIVQFIGRIAFFAGYPYYRTFGVSLTATPNTIMLIFNLYKLGAYMNFY